jgi:hypothetical protein
MEADDVTTASSVATETSTQHVADSSSPATGIVTKRGPTVIEIDLFRDEPGNSISAPW